ncbi:MAG TPA: hypothetical protein PKY12_10435, partial [Catalimonadaceae bacterium]|nr:hypothetical protein [Catalimonadaceae bacterium]
MKIFYFKSTLYFFIATIGAFNLLAQTPKRKQFIETNGPVYTIKKDGNTLYMGGTFSGGGYNSGRAALVSTTNDFPDPALPRVNGAVNSIISDGSGGWFIAGSFSKVGGQTVNNLVHIKSDKTIDQNFLPNPNSSIQCQFLSGSKLYIGGNFTSVASNTINRLACINVSDGSLVDWNPNPNATVYWIDVTGNVVTIGGTFTKIGDQPVSYFGKINATDATPIPSIGLNSYTYTGKKKDGILYVGGSFTNGGYNVDRSTLFQGTNDEPLFTFPTANSTINCSVSDGAGGWYVGGSFSAIGNTNRKYLAHILADFSIDPNFSPDPNSTVQCMQKVGNLLYVGGSFTTIAGNNANRAAAIDLNSGNATDFNPDLNSTVHSILVSGSDVYLGGSFTQVGGKPQSYFCRTNATTGALLESFTTNYIVYKMLKDGNNLYMGGAFSQTGYESNSIAELTTTNDFPTFQFPKANGAIYTIVPD